MKSLVVTHGDTDGVISAALVVKKHGLDISKTDVVFTQPYLVDGIDLKGYEKVFVADLAVNNRNPEMTSKFIDSLGQKLVVWYDHHKGWGNSGLVDSRFIIDESAPSCAAVIGGNSKWIGAANVIDSRKGSSDLGQLIDQAITVNLSDNSVRQVALEYILGLNDDEILREKQREYREVEEKTKELVNSGVLKGKALVIDARGQKGFDRTQLFMKGYDLASFVVILGEFEGKITTTVATNTGLNLVELFGLKSGAPFRVSLEGDRVDFVLRKLKRGEKNGNF